MKAIDVSGIKDRLFHAAVGGGSVRKLTDDYAVVFHPAASYYNRGRNTISSHIDIVFRKFNGFNHEKQSAEFLRDVRPTQSVIDSASSEAERVLKTVRPAEELISIVGLGKELSVGRYGVLRVDDTGVPVAFYWDASNKGVVKQIGNGRYVTTSPEYEEEQEIARKKAKEQALEDSVTAWIAEFEAADPDRKRALVKSKLRI